MNWEDISGKLNFFFKLPRVGTGDDVGIGDDVGNDAQTNLATEFSYWIS